MKIIQFFSHAHPYIQTLFFTMLFLICWNIENFYGVTRNYKKFKTSSINFYFVLSGSFVQFIMGFLFVKILTLENIHQYGFSKLSNVTSIILTFICLDFAYYIYHVVMHKVKKIWRFHAVHHSDVVLNVSTSLREHPVETVIRLSQYMAVSLFLGPMLWILALHQFVQIASKIIIHSNFRLPDKLDKYLSYLVITPNMHHVHHHFKQPYTDSNYGDLFSIWDRMFGTFTYLSKEQVQFGLDEVDQLKIISPLNLIKTNIFRK